MYKCVYTQYIFMEDTRKQKLKSPLIYHIHVYICIICLGLPWCLISKESTCQCRRLEFNPWVRKIPGDGNGNPHEYS